MKTKIIFLSLSIFFLANAALAQDSGGPVSTSPAKPIDFSTLRQSNSAPANTETLQPTEGQFSTVNPADESAKNNLSSSSLVSTSSIIGKEQPAAEKNNSLTSNTEPISREQQIPVAIRQSSDTFFLWAVSVFNLFLSLAVLFMLYRQRTTNRQ